MSVSSSYLNSCSSGKSQERIASELRRLAKLMCISSVDEIDWQHFSRAFVVDLLGRPELKKRKASAQNFTLSVIKRLCEEACYAQLLPDTLFLAIKRIPNFRGIRCPSPKCLLRTKCPECSETVPKKNQSRALVMLPFSPSDLAADCAAVK